MRSEIPYVPARFASANMPLRQFRARGRRPAFWHYGQWPAPPRPIVARRSRPGAGRLPGSPPPSPLCRRNRAGPATNSRTATSLAALSTVGAEPPAASARRAMPSAGKRVRSGSSKLKLATRARSSRGAGVPMRTGQAKQCAIGIRMSGEPKLGDHRTVAKFDEAMNDGLWMDDERRARPAAMQTSDGPR